MSLSLDQLEMLDSNAYSLRFLRPTVVRSLQERKLIQVKSTYIALRADSEQHLIPGTEYRVTIYCRTQLSNTDHDEHTENRELLVSITQETPKHQSDEGGRGTEHSLPVAADSRVQEVIDTINRLYEEVEGQHYQEVHITDIWVGTPRLSLDETQVVVDWMEIEDILRFNASWNLFFLDMYHPSLAKHIPEGIIKSPIAPSLLQATVDVQNTEELYVVLDLSVNEELSQRFVEELFPYEAGDAVILCDVRDALAVLRLQRIMLTKEQRQALRETTAIVGYTLKVREELTSFLSEFYGL